MTGANMFAYCGNNPVNGVDTGGCLHQKVRDFVIGFLVEGALYCVEVVIRDDKSFNLWEFIAVGLAGGASNLLENPYLTAAVAGAESLICGFINGDGFGKTLLRAIVSMVVSFISPSILAKFDSMGINIEDKLTEMIYKVYDLSAKILNDAIDYMFDYENPGTKKQKEIILPPYISKRVRTNNLYDTTQFQRVSVSCFNNTYERIKF